MSMNSTSQGDLGPTPEIQCRVTKTALSGLMEMAPINEFVTGYIIIDGNQVATPGKAQIMSMTASIRIQ